MSRHEEPNPQHTSPELPEFVLSSAQPHGENPISHDTFGRLDDQVTEINSELGIGEKTDRFYAVSPGAHEMTVARYETQSGAVTVAINFRTNDGLANIVAHSRAGTIDNPDQPAASLTVLDSHGHFLLTNEGMGDEELDTFTDLIRDRAQMVGFQRQWKGVSLLAAV